MGEICPVNIFDEINGVKEVGEIGEIGVEERELNWEKSAVPLPTGVLKSSAKRSAIRFRLAETVEPASVSSVDGLRRGKSVESVKSVKSVESVKILGLFIWLIKSLARAHSSISFCARLVLRVKTYFFNVGEYEIPRFSV